MKKTFPLNINFNNLFSPTPTGKRQTGKDKETNLLLRREEMEGKRRKKKGGVYTYNIIYRATSKLSKRRSDRSIAYKCNFLTGHRLSENRSSIPDCARLNINAQEWILIIIRLNMIKSLACGQILCQHCPLLRNSLIQLFVMCTVPMDYCIFDCTFRSTISFFSLLVFFFFFFIRVELFWFIFQNPRENLLWCISER